MPITIKDIVGNTGGTTNYVPKFTPDGFHFGNSQIFDNGTNVGFGTTSPTAIIHAKGVDSTSSNYTIKADNSANAPLLYVRNDGNVGIGIGSPTARLHTKETSTVTTNYISKFESGGGVSSIAMRNDLSTFYGEPSTATRQVFENGGNRLIFGTASEHDSANLYIKAAAVLPSHFINVVNGSNFNYFSIKNDGKSAFGLQQNYAMPYDVVLQVMGGNTSSDRLFSVKNNITNSDLFFVRGDGSAFVGSSSGSNLLNVYHTKTATSMGSTIDAINLGGQYSNTAGSFPKVILYDAGGSIAGFGVSAGQIDYIGYSASVNHVFYAGATRVATIQGDGNVSFSNTTAPSCAKVDFVSTTGGVLFPRMTTTQKNNIPSPLAGLVVYDTTLNKLCVYTTAWETITSS